jgi:hypothetical protein
MKRIDNLIKNDTGYSSKNFALLLGIITVFVVSIGFMALLFIDMLCPDKSIKTDMYAMAALIGAIDVLVGWLFYQKVKSEKNHKPYKNTENEENSSNC